MTNLEGLNYDYVLPDYNLLFKEKNFKNLGENLYCSSAVFNEFKSNNPDEINKSQKIEIMENCLKKILLKNSNPRFERKYRSVRECSGGKLDKDSYNHLVSAAFLVVNGKKVAIVSNNPLMEEAYVNLVGKNSYLNNENFSFFRG